MKHIMFILFIFLFYSSCASMLPGMRGDMLKKGVIIENDDFNNIQKIKLNLPIGSLKNWNECSLGFIQYKAPKKEPTLMMYTYLYQSGWLFVESVSFNLDGKVYTYKSYDDTRNVLDGSYVEEYNRYEVTQEFINKLAKAEKIRIRLIGESQYVEPDFKSDNKLLVNEFLEKIK